MILKLKYRIFFSIYKVLPNLKLRFFFFVNVGTLLNFELSNRKILSFELSNRKILIKWEQFQINWSTHLLFNIKIFNIIEMKQPTAHSVSKLTIYAKTRIICDHIFLYHFKFLKGNRSMQDLKPRARWVKLLASKAIINQVNLFYNTISKK